MKNTIVLEKSPAFAAVTEVGLHAMLPKSGSLREAKTEIAGSFIAPKGEEPPLVENGDIPPGM